MQKIFFLGINVWIDKDKGYFDMDIDPQSQSSFLDEKEMEKNMEEESVSAWSMWMKKFQTSGGGLCFGIKCPHFKGTY